MLGRYNLGEDQSKLNTAIDAVATAVDIPELDKAANTVADTAVNMAVWWGVYYIAFGEIMPRVLDRFDKSGKRKGPMLTGFKEKAIWATAAFIFANPMFVAPYFRVFSKG